MGNSLSPVSSQASPSPQAELAIEGCRNDPLVAAILPCDVEVETPEPAIEQAVFAPPALSVAATIEDDADEKLCRYCFEGDEAGELIAPCRCAGGQKWVHLSCLRRWQRGVLVSQPTHPDYYDDDIRHRICGVCKSPFTCRPPTRLELMQSFTGEELGALVEEGCIIGTHRDFSNEMRRQVSPFPAHLREAVMDHHWIDGVFLIVKVVEDRGMTTCLRLDDEMDLQAFAASLSEDWCWQLRGRLHKLCFDGPLEAVAEAPAEEKRAGIRGLELPCALKLSPADEGDCGEDGIMAVNLTRPFDITKGSVNMMRNLQFQAAVRKALAGGTLLPEVTHFVGGPCTESRAQFAIVTCGAESYQVHSRLKEAIQAAQELCSGEPVVQLTMTECSAVSSIEDSELVAAAPNEADERAAKRRKEEAGDSDDASTTASSRASPNLAASVAPAPAARSDVRLLVFWGAAGWSRCQLMGEIASGSWGLCKSTTEDVAVTKSDEVYESSYPRLVFAPKTEMSDSYPQGGSLDELDRAQLLRLHRRLRRRQQQIQARQQRASADVARQAAPEGAVQSDPDGDGNGEDGLDEDIDVDDIYDLDDDEEDDDHDEYDDEDSGEEEQAVPDNPDDETAEQRLTIDAEVQSAPSFED